jgi:peptide/nickel transport system permease protein
MKSNVKSFGRFLKDPITLISLGPILIYTLLALLAGLGFLASDFASTHLELSYQPPSANHWLGTDFLGRNVLSRAIHGAKVAMLVGFFAASIATLIGLTLGAIAGFFGGWVDDLVVWLYTTLESIPYILLISAFAFSLGQGLTNLYIALGLTGWVKLCRLTRGEFLRHKNRDYVTAAQALGSSTGAQIFKHILPNVLHLAYIQYSLSFIHAVKVEVILSYLGLGVEPGTPSWGIMINDAKAELTRGVWWNMAAATVFMFFLILSVNLFADNLKKFLDPKIKQI